MPQGHVSAIATYLTQSGTRRLLRCHPCVTPCAATRETVFVARRTSAETVMMALTMLLVWVALAGMRFVLGVTEATVWAWLRRAAAQTVGAKQASSSALVKRSGRGRGVLGGVVAKHL